jgi:fatty-acyl-CoA synthase
MTVLRLGGTVVAMKKFDAAEALRLLGEHHVTHSQWVPTMFARMLALAERPANPRSHICAIHAGAPCPPDIKRRMIEWWGPILHEYYSGTEAVGFTHITSAEWLERPGSVGRAYGAVIHILDEDDNPLPPGVTGRVFFESATPLAYHNAPEKTAAATSRQGYATMGDIGYVDAEGYLWLTDRAGFTIISGGVNIYPAEIEAALMSDPRIVDCAVFGVPDPDLGEVVQAVVELREPADDPAATARAIADRLRGLVAAIKIPRQIAFTDRLPRTESGKVQKRILAEYYANPSRRGYFGRVREKH